MRSAAGRTCARALLASAGVNVRSDTDARPSYEQRGADPGRLAAWLAFVGFLIVLAYTQRAENGAPDNDVFYRYSTAISGIVVYAIMLLVTLAIAGFDRDRLALRRPRSWALALGLGVLMIVVVYMAIAVLEPLLPGDSWGQGQFAYWLLDHDANATPQDEDRIAAAAGDLPRCRAEAVAEIQLQHVAARQLLDPRAPQSAIRAVSIHAR